MPAPPGLVWKFHEDGTFDESFGTGGQVGDVIVETDNDGFDAALSPSGEVVLLMSGTVVLLRRDGSIDESFGDAGTASSTVRSSASQALGVGSSPGPGPSILPPQTILSCRAAGTEHVP